MCLQTAELCYAQPLNNCIFFGDEPFLSHLYEIYLSIKDLEILAESRLCTQKKTVCDTNFVSFGEFGISFPVQFSSRSHFVNIEYKKKLSPKINVKNIKTRV